MAKNLSIQITLQRYGENPDGAILKTEVFAVGIWSASTETRLARSRYLCGQLVIFRTKANIKYKIIGVR
jgi:hypothetical protein